VSSLLETIVNDDSNKTGLKLLLKKKDIGLYVLEHMSDTYTLVSWEKALPPRQVRQLAWYVLTAGAIMSFNLVQVISAMTKGTKESDNLVRKIFEGIWPDEVTEEGIKLFKEIKAQGRSTPIVRPHLPTVTDALRC
jgi:hypothetical protein